MKSVLVTGSSGLIGSEVCHYFATELGYKVHGLDNNQRAVFFGPQGDSRHRNQAEPSHRGGLFAKSEDRDPGRLRPLLWRAL